MSERGLTSTLQMSTNNGCCRWSFLLLSATDGSKTGEKLCAWSMSQTLYSAPWLCCRLIR